MATFPITATPDEIDGLTVHFDTDRNDGALFWDFAGDLDGGHLQAPAECAHRFGQPGDYTVTARALNGDTGTVNVTVPGAGGGAGMAWTLDSSFPASAAVGSSGQVHVFGTGLPTALPATGWSIRVAGIALDNLGIGAPGTDFLGFLGPLVGKVLAGVYDVAVIAPDGAQILPAAFTLT